MAEGQKVAEAAEEPRIPVAAGEIQINFCKNPSCGQFAVPADTGKQPRGRLPEGVETDTYRLTGTETQLFCKLCKEHLPIKSNLGIVEELQRVSAWLATPAQAACKTPGCDNFGFPASDFSDRYWLFGKTNAGTPRFRCKSCKSTFIGTANPILRQRKSYVNSEVFRAITQKMPFSGVAEFARISPSTLYRKLNFIHRQCLLFAANRERRLASMPFKRMYLCVDRMDHVINWSNREDKRNITLQAVGTAHLDSGYVIALHANYDSAASRDDVALEAVECNDHLQKPYFRRHARYWLPAEYEAAVQVGGATLPSRHGISSLDEWIETVYATAAARGDVERPDHPKKSWQAPGKGLLIHAEYTLYAHFFYLRQLLPNVEKYRFFLDQESGIRAACLAAFADEVQRKDCDAFYVSIKKGMSKERALNLISESRQKLEVFAQERGLECLRLQDLRRYYMKEKMADLMTQKGKWGDRWIEHPFPDMSEPEKRVCYLTSLKADWFDYDDEHLANLVLKATLHPIDRFFMQTRRKTSMLERSITSSSAAGRKWYGYSAYDPANALKMLEVYRVYYNYVKLGDDKKTPAMRLGLAKGPCSVEDILYYRT